MSGMKLIIAYIVLFCLVPMFRLLFLHEGQHVLFWLLFFEYVFMTPYSLTVFATARRPRLLSLGLGALVTAGLLLVLCLVTIHNMSDRGMGVLVFLLFPLVDAFMALTGVLCLVAWAARKTGEKLSRKPVDGKAVE